MKELFTKITRLFLTSIALITLGILFCKSTLAQSVAIGGSANIIPAASSVLDIQSTSRGLLIPRMTTTERNAITNPANGLIIYNTTTSQFNFYSTASNNWIEFASTTNLIAGTGITFNNTPGSITISSSSTNINMVTVTSNFALTTAWQNVSGLSYSLSANTAYRFRAMILYKSTDNKEGANFSFSIPANTAGVSAGNDVIAYGGISPKSNNTGDAERFTGNGYNLSQGTSGSLSGANFSIIEGIIKVGTAGIFSVRGIATADNKLTVLPGSSMEIW